VLDYALSPLIIWILNVRVLGTDTNVLYTDTDSVEWTDTEGVVWDHDVHAGVEIPVLLRKSSTKEMNCAYPSWRTDEHNKPDRYILDYKTGYITFYPRPDVAYSVYMQVIRYPLIAFTTTAMSSQTPEIDVKYHPSLIDGIVYQAFLKPGENTYDAQKSATHLQFFRRAISGMKIHTEYFTGANDPVGPHGGFI
jgi:hypothetical protein